MARNSKVVPALDDIRQSKQTVRKKSAASGLGESGIMNGGGSVERSQTSQRSFQCHGEEQGASGGGKLFWCANRPQKKNGPTEMRTNETSAGLKCKVIGISLEADLETSISYHSRRGGRQAPKCDYQTQEAENARGSVFEKKASYPSRGGKPSSYRKQGGDLR